jgi:hypothetical protein
LIEIFRKPLKPNVFGAMASATLNAQNFTLISCTSVGSLRPAETGLLRLPRAPKRLGWLSLEAVSALTAIAIAVSLALFSTSRVNAHPRRTNECATTMSKAQHSSAAHDKFCKARAA